MGVGNDGFNEPVLCAVTVLTVVVGRLPWVAGVPAFAHGASTAVVDGGMFGFGDPSGDDPFRCFCDLLL